MTETLPPKIAAALVEVMQGVPKLEKGEKNSHGNYNFASIDDFLEAVRPLCAEAGLIIIQDEESFETTAGTDRNGNPRTWLLMKFSYTLAHSSGEVWDRKPVRSIMVDASVGAQAFGAAQSYALKQFMRSLFQIATGEKGQDADEHPNADLPDVPKEKTTKDADWVGPLNKTALKTEMRELISHIRGASDNIELDGYLDDYEAVINQCKEDLPEWITGDGGDKHGLDGAVEMMRAEFKLADDPSRYLEAG